MKKIGKLVFMNCSTPENISVKKNGNRWGMYGFIPSGTPDIYLKPITISETEPVEVGDIALETLVDGSKMLIQIDNINDIDKEHQVKVIALHEDFTPKDLQAMVDGKIKEGDIIEMDEERMSSTKRLAEWRSVRKRNYKEVESIEIPEIDQVLAARARRLAEEPQEHIHDELVGMCNEMSVRIKIYKIDSSNLSIAEQEKFTEARRRHLEPTWDEILELLDRCRDEMNQCTRPFRKR